MLQRLIISIFLLFFVAACGSAPKDESAAAGSGLTSVDYTSDGIRAGSADDLIINVGDRVFFEFASHELSGDAKEQLQAQTSWLKQYSNVSITIEGHCDERGTREYNLALGERRANAAKDYLMTYGVASNRISVISYGKEGPVDSGSNPLAWSKNRRSVTVKAN